MSSFDSAKRKLDEAPTPYPLEDLPQDNNDDAWTVIRSEYGLTLPEWVALKNHRGQQQQPSLQAAAPSRQARGILVEEIMRTSCKCYLDGNIVDLQELSHEEAAHRLHTFFRDHSRPHDNAQALAMDDIRLDDDIKKEVSQPLAVDFTQLRSQTETTFQRGNLTAHFFRMSEAKAIDLSAVAAHGPFFKPNQSTFEFRENLPVEETESGQEDPVNPETFRQSVSIMSGKIDGTSMVGPIDLEIKTSFSRDVVTSSQISTVDYAVINQAVERVVVRMNLYGFLSKALAFAVSDRSAWCIVGFRSGDIIDGRMAYSLHIRRIPHAAVPVLWMKVTKQAERSLSHFMTSDGVALCAAMVAMGLAPWTCRTKFLAASESNVYGVTLPRSYLWADHASAPKRRRLGINSTREAITYAFKIGYDDELFRTEAAALRTISTHVKNAGQDERYYALGIFKNSSREFDKFNDIELGSTAVNSRLKNCWWHRLHEHVPPGLPGGVIVMEAGVPYTRLDPRPSRSSACEDLLDSVRRSHSAGILHRDIRWPNVVQFGSRLHLVDYGLSSTVDCTGAFIPPGGQRDALGPRAKRLVESHRQVTWEPADDYEMLATMLVSD